MCLSDMMPKFGCLSAEWRHSTLILVLFYTFTVREQPPHSMPSNFTLLWPFYRFDRTIFRPVFFSSPISFYRFRSFRLFNSLAVISHFSGSAAQHPFHFAYVVLFRFSPNQIFTDNTESIKAIISVQPGQEKSSPTHLHVRAERTDSAATGKGPSEEVRLHGKVGKCLFVYGFVSTEILFPCDFGGGLVGDRFELIFGGWSYHCSWCLSP